ncbi:MAG: hypothetical protein ABW134_11910 [Candidatus Thiodiazotropha endolucinida]
MDELQGLQARLKSVITGTCNTVGCKDCGLKYDEDGKKCSATYLQGRIMDLEYLEMTDSGEGIE